jgi:hydrogenase maturation protein HypF
MKRVRIIIHGAVQGVGFRPFVYRLAAELGLNGWVLNSSQGVFIEAEGCKETLDGFILRIEKEKPALSFIQSMEFSFLDPVGFNKFEIRSSSEEGSKTALVLPDIAICKDCLNDILNPHNRRYLYPFTNCTNCGPRFSIIERLPYDRKNTTMKKFEMCDKCRLEYEDPSNRRFHAQPNACPDCGPHIELWDTDGNTLAVLHEALLQAVENIHSGWIAAVKGLGGFHLMADAYDEETVRLLRKRKRREEKPLALMFPDIELISKYCEVSELEKRLLRSPESPIVLLKKKKEVREKLLAESVAPGNPYLGVMLPYTPLHYILMRELNVPVIATSGNISDEPICIDENEAIVRLKGIADIFLVHNRPIVRHVDDSIVRIIHGREMVVRRARGYAPLPVHLDHRHNERHYLAVGAHLKNTIAVSSNNNIFISQHIGDLETSEAYSAFNNVITDLSGIYDIEPKTIAADMHPNYISTQYALTSAIHTVQVQHHHAHILSCMAENEITEPALGVSWDGTGYGTDNTIWGGEFLLINGNSFHRIAHLRSFRLPGGEIAIKEIWRTYTGILFEIYGEGIFTNRELFPDNLCTPKEKEIIKKMLVRNLNSPVTTSAGRLFDAIAFATGVSGYSSYEGQAAMQLEFETELVNTNDVYPFHILDVIDKKSDVRFILDWGPMVKQILNDRKNKKDSAGVISAKFHNTLTQLIIDTAKRVGEEKVVLSGGCFQNKYLIERTIYELEKNGFKPYWHQRVPTNDGGISLGQISAAIMKKEGIN